MSIPSLTSRIEAILYLKGRPISLSELAELARDEPDQVRTAIAMLTTSYAQRDTALEVVEQSGRYCLQLRPALADLVKNMLPVNLSTATLRTSGDDRAQKTHPSIRSGGPTGLRRLRPHQGTSGPGLHRTAAPERWPVVLADPFRKISSHLLRSA